VVERGAKWVRRRPAAAALVGVLVLAAAAVAAAVPVVFAELRAAADEATQKANAEGRAREEAVREKEAAERRAELSDLLRQGQEDLARRGPDGRNAARVRLMQVRDRIEDHEAQDSPELAELQRQAVRLLGDLDRREEAHRDYQALLDGRDRALFLLYRDVFTGTDDASPAQTREEARKALAPWGLPEGPLRQDLADALEPVERADLPARLYEVSLVLAEALVRGQPPPEQRRLAGEALRVLDRAAPLAPDPAALRRRRARYLALQGEAAAAAGEQAGAGDQPPRNAVDWFFAGCDRALADRAFNREDWRAAVDAFDRALREDPGLFWARFFRAVGCQKLGEPQRAIDSLTVCATQRPEFPWTYLLRGSLYGQIGAFGDAAEDFGGAERLVSDDSQRYVLLVNRGYVALRRKEARVAARDLEQAVVLRPDLYPALVNLAEARLLLGEPRRAVEHLTKAITLQPAMGVLYRTRARAHLRTGDRRAALRDLDEAIRRTPREDAAGLARDHRERAQVLYELERYPAAEQACRDALALAPRDPDAHHLHGAVLLKMGFYEEALVALDHCVGQEKFRPGANFYRQRARARRELRDFAGAAEEYTRALGLAPRDAGLYTLRGLAYLDGDFTPALALRDFDEALRLDPADSDALLGRGTAKARQGAHRQAAADAEKALGQARRLGGEDRQRLYYNAARVFSQAIAALDGGPAPFTPPAVETRSHYQDRAGDCLAGVRDLLPDNERPSFWVNQVLRDPAFRPLSGTPLFARLAVDFTRPPR
jgi:tetratricopeptide (TPR) repeat protein